MTDIKDLEGLEIFLGYTCNVKCSFCYQKDLRVKYPQNIGRDEVTRLIKEGAVNNKKFIIFSGGEATLDKYLPEYISYANILGYQHIRVHTNGFGFQKYEYLYDLYNRGLTGVTISIHGYGEVHDDIVGVRGSFEKIKKALLNFEALKAIDQSFIFDTNTVICRQNYKSLDSLIIYLCKFHVTRGQIVLAYSLGLFSKEEKYEIIPSFQEVIPYVVRLIYISRKFSRKFVLENIPFCVLSPKYYDAVINNIKVEKDSITIQDGNFGNTNAKWMQYKDECSRCSMKKICRGIPKDYYEIYGGRFIKAIKG